MEHIAHDDGILAGWAAGCPRCLTYRLYSLDDGNMLRVTGMTRREIENWLKSGPLTWDMVSDFYAIDVYRDVLRKGYTSHEVFAAYHDAREKFNEVKQHERLH